MVGCAVAAETKWYFCSKPHCIMDLVTINTLIRKRGGQDQIPGTLLRKVWEEQHWKTKEKQQAGGRWAARHQGRKGGLGSVLTPSGVRGGMPVDAGSGVLPQTTLEPGVLTSKLWL